VCPDLQPNQLFVSRSGIEPDVERENKTTRNTMGMTQHGVDESL
jgi:hypothetical protein